MPFSFFAFQVSELTIRDEREKLECYIEKNLAEDNVKVSFYCTFHGSKCSQTQSLQDDSEKHTNTVVLFQMPIILS